MAINRIFRTCPSTGLKIHQPAENLIKANAVAAVVFLAVGGLFGLSVALTRWPAVHLLPADWFYLALTAHGLDVLIVWIIFFEMAILYFASAILLNSRLATPRWAWAGFWMMLVGALIVNVAVLAGEFQRHVHFLRAHESIAVVLRRLSDVRGRGTNRSFRILWHLGHRQGREDL